MARHQPTTPNENSAQRSEHPAAIEIQETLIGGHHVEGTLAKGRVFGRCYLEANLKPINVGKPPGFLDLFRSNIDSGYAASSSSKGTRNHASTGSKVQYALPD